jgi:tetratricopeptide (TPR) repeat protein
MPVGTLVVLLGLTWWCAGATDEATQAALHDAYNSTDPQALNKAGETLEERLKTDPENLEIEQALGILYLDKLNTPAKAQPHLEKVVTRLPNDANWHLALARALRGAGASERAAAAFSKAAELQPGEAWPRYELGNTLSASGKYRKAITAYRAAVSLDPKSPYIRVALANTLWASGQITEAVRIARSVLKDEPKNEAALKLVAAAPSAPAPLKAPRATARAMSPLDGAVAKAYSSGRKADFERAAELLEARLRKRPADLARRKILGDIYLEKLDAPAKAVPHLAKVVEAAPRDPAWWQMLGKAQARSRDFGGATMSYRKAADLAPRDVWSRYHLGETLRDAGRRKPAVAAFREALAIDPRNKYVLLELAKLARADGQSKQAAELAHTVLEIDPRDAEAHALLGDLLRADQELAKATTEYQEALAIEPANAAAQTGLRAIETQQSPLLKLAYYTFEDTVDLQQSGIYSYFSAPITDRLRAFIFANELFFKQPPNETSERFETGFGFNYTINSALQIAAGASRFKTENLDAEYGGNVVLYFRPFSMLDGWISYRSGEPVNDSYFTVSESFTQDIFSGGLNYRPHRLVMASLSASTSDYSDGNTRTSFLASLAYYLPVKTAPVLKLEYEYLNFSDQTPLYSSPDNYTRFRPVLEWTPELTSWLKLECHGELTYVFDEAEWGYGVVVGPRIHRGDDLELGFTYLDYSIPGGLTSWSGSGFKVDFLYRF